MVDNAHEFLIEAAFREISLAGGDRVRVRVRVRVGA